MLKNVGHINSVGGASDTEQTAVAVAPVLPGLERVPAFVF